jgi:hypothetical protein
LQILNHSIDQDENIAADEENCDTANVEYIKKLEDN